jgi:hypothetical protein
MGRRAITHKEYESLLASYSMTPGNHNRAARVSGLKWESAKRGYERGWPDQGFRPIKALLAEVEEHVTRAAQEVVRKKGVSSLLPPQAPLPSLPVPENDSQERIKAALTAMEEEERITIAFRKGAFAITAVSSQLINGTLPLAPKIMAALQKRAQEGLTFEDIPRVMRVLQAVASFTAQAQSIAQTAMRMERLRLGASEITVGVEEKPAPAEEAPKKEITYEELLAELRALERLEGKTIDAEDDDGVSELIAKAERHSVTQEEYDVTPEAE